MSRIPKSTSQLSFSQPIRQWDEAIPLGNGRMGCLIWGESDHLRFSLDRTDIWDVTPYPGIYDADFTYAHLVELAKAGDTEAIRAKFDAPYNAPTPTKLPAGKIIFNFGKSRNVISQLNIANAEAQIDLVGKAKLSAYHHACENAGFIRVELPSSAFSFAIENPPFGIAGEEYTYVYDVDAREISNGSLGQLKYPRPVLGSEEGETALRWFVQKVSDTLSYGIVLAYGQREGGTELVYTVAASMDGTNWLEDAKRRVRRMLAEGYYTAQKRHADWWVRYWQASAIHLPDPFMEKNWYITQYLLASCSRKGAPPMPLQGVWTADNGQLPPWKGDYHHDLNTQMCYYSYAKANHIEQGESFIDFLWEKVPAARRFARSFYGTGGICLPAVMDIEGKPLGGWPMYSLSPTQQLWLCQSFERHYRFTGDMDFLRQRAYPYMKESGEFILGLLTLNEQGYYVLPVSSSAEIHNDTAAAWLTPNTNYDLSIMVYLFRQLERLAKILNNGEAERWSEVCRHMAPLAVNEEHVLMLSPDESLQESHRHLAHCMAIHPLRLLDYENPQEKEIIDATVLNLERLGPGNWTGFSVAWMAELYAIQGNGEGAAYQLRNFWENFCSPNGFHLNGDYRNRGVSSLHYRPFTLEGNMCAADALQEMLLRTEDGIIQVFPAIPEAWWREGCSFEDLRGENGILISAWAEQGRVSCIQLVPQRDGIYELVSPWGDSLYTGSVPCVEEETRPGHFRVNLKKGEVYRFFAQ